MRNFVLLALVLGLAACRGGGNSGDDDTTPDGQTNTDDVKIQDIQNDSMPACDLADPATCTPFAVRGVVVTAIDSYGADTDDFWVQEPDGGPFSGVKVFGATIDQRAVLAPGDVIDIEGAVKDEFACEPCMKPDTSGRSITEIKPAPGGTLTITKKSSGMPVEPEQVDALAIGMMASADRDAEWEKWEGVVISVANVTQTAKEFAPNMPDPDDHEFKITGDVRVRSALVALPADNDINDCYASITGIGDYFFNWLLIPRNAEDFGGAGAGCPVAEVACTDGVDNDGNGFMDCDDFSCQSTEPTCVSHPTIEAIQTGEATGPVELEDVYVVALTYNKTQLWVASSPTAAANQGIYVYRGSSAAPLDDTMFVPGAKVAIKGVVQENNNDAMGDTLTQIGANPSVTFVAPPSATPVPVTNVSAADLVAATTGEPYESVLVTLTNVKVKTQGTNAGYYVGELDQGGTVFFSDDDVFRLLDPKDTCYASITGIWSYDVFSNAYGLLPTVAPTPNGTCN